MNWFQKAANPMVDDENLRRQGFLVIVVSAVLILLSSILMLNTLFSGITKPTDVVSFVGLLIYCCCLVMAKRGLVRPAAYVVTYIPMLVVLVTLIMSPNPVIVCFLIIPVLFASIVLPSVHMIPVVLISVLVAVYAATYGNADSDSFFPVIFLVIAISGLAYLSAWSVERALGIIRHARHELEQANNALSAVNGDLEQRVVLRTADLEKTVLQLQLRERELQETFDALQSSQDTIREMSVPVLPVSRDTLVMPLVGALDSERLIQIQEQALSRLEATHARRLLLDITAVPVVDTQVAQGLIRVVQAAQLLGAQVLLVGIRPEVAQSVVGLGVDLSSVRTHSDLQGALAA